MSKADKNAQEENAERGSSPPCYAAEMDAAYAGYLRSEELVLALNVLLESERAGAKVLARFRREAPDAPATRLLEEVGRDEARYVALLSGLVRKLGATPSENTGGFHEKALAIEGFEERLAFLNRGQGWVAKRLREILPRVESNETHAALKEMLATHEANIGRCEALLNKPGRSASISGSQPL